MDAELIADYVSETEERLDRISSELLGLEESSSFDSVLVKRELHTLKGLSASLGYREVAELCHTVEDHFDQVDRRERPLLFDAVFTACDFIAAHVKALQVGAPQPRLPSSIEMAFDALSDSMSATMTAANRLTASGRRGLDESRLSALRSMQGTASRFVGSLDDDAGIKHRNYLVVDDDPAIQRLIVKVLEDFGTCTVAQNGQEGVQLFESAIRSGEAFDGIYLDINMPVMNGHRALEQIRCIEHAHGRFGSQGTKIVVVTSEEGERHEVKAYKAGCQLFLKKPLRATELRRSFAILGILGDAQPRSRRGMMFLDDVRTVGLRDMRGGYQLAEVRCESFDAISLLVDDVSRLRPGERMSIDYRHRPMPAVLQNIDPVSEDGRYCVRLEWCLSS